jgi:hypothetical protein
MSKTRIAFAAMMLGSLLVSGCVSPPDQNDPIVVKPMLIHDDGGVKLYRFYDKSYWRYYVIYDGGATVNGVHRNGKTHKPDEVPTIILPVEGK